jgi:glutamine synthetase
MKGNPNNLERALAKVLRDSWKANKKIIFDGDNYAPEWHAEAEKRGLYNLRSTPEALPWLVDKTTVALFKRHGVLSRRELESRYEVFLEQYAVKINIEAETAASIARTQILPAATRHLAEVQAVGLDELSEEIEPVVKELHFALRALEDANLADNQDDSTPLKWARYVHSRVIPAMEDVREVADRLEKLVADDLWPLPKYSEMLFIK